MTKSDIPVARAFRVWLGVEVLFGLATLLSLGRFPEETATRFAWPIVPTLTAAVLGGFYLSLTPVLVLALFVRRWSMVRVIVLPALAFTTAELLATILHWDRFSTGTLPFNVWLASYILPPPIFLAAYLWHQRRFSAPSGNHLPPWLRTVLLASGVLFSAEMVVAFVYPQWLIGSFPWMLTPLTARVLAGWLILVGALDGLRGRPRPRAAGQPLPDPAAPHLRAPAAALRQRGRRLEPSALDRSGALQRPLRL